MKILFIGGGKWGTPLLPIVIEVGHEVVIVDGPRINGKSSFCGGMLLRKILHSSRLLQAIYSLGSARENIFYETIWRYRLPVILTESINSKSFLAKIKRYNFDVILVASCAEILNEVILNIPRLGCINYHPSLLPKYRGPDPFYWTLRNKEKQTGITFHFIDGRVDTGNIILQQKVDISTDDDEESLIAKCTSLASAAVSNVLASVDKGGFDAQPQNAADATYYSAVTIKPSDKFSIRELSDKEDVLWDREINNSLQYNFFSSSLWMDMLTRATGVQHKKIVCFYDGQPLCGCAALVKKSLEGRLLTGGPLSQYSTILQFPSRDHDMPIQGLSDEYRQLKSLLAISDYMKYKFDWSVLYLHPNFKDSALFSQEGWHQDWRYTYYLDLRDPEALYANFGSSLKRQIKKAQCGDFRIEEGLDSPELFYVAWCQTMKAQGVKPPLKKGAFNYIYRQLKENNLSRVVCAYKGNSLAAVVIFIIDKEKAYYWASTLNKEYAASGINQALLWQGLRDLSESGIKDFDFIGADIPSIASYKKRYGGRLVRHLRIIHRSSLRAKVVQGVKRLYKGCVKKHD